MPVTENDTTMWRERILRRAQELVASLGEGTPSSDTPCLEAAELAAMIDHTLLKPDATASMVDTLCAEAREYGFASVCVNPYQVARCVRNLRGSDVPVCSVVGFPLGATLPGAKAAETELVLADGATEVDMVINVGALKSGKLVAVKEDISAVVEAAHTAGAHCKVIIEACLLTDEEKAIACLLIAEAGADFCKTSTGFSGGGATVQDVALMRHVVGPDMGIKAAGGIRTYETAMAMIAAGATRIGASAGITIVQGARS